MSFARRYGPCALVAGASEGLGAAFADALAARGLDLMLVARREGPLAEIAARLRERHAVETLPVAADLSDPNVLDQLEAARGERQIGLLIYNAAFSPIGPFLRRDLEEHRRALRVNCESLMTLTHHYGRLMATRKRGGILLMSSLSGIAGSPLISSYAATKAFSNALAAGLWQELRPHGVDVLACCAGATRTPGYLASLPQNPPKVPEQQPAAVVAEALESLPRGPICISGHINRLSAWAMQRLLPRRLAVALMGRATGALYAGERQDR